VAWLLGESLVTVLDDISNGSDSDGDSGKIDELHKLVIEACSDEIVGDLCGSDHIVSQLSTLIVSVQTPQKAAASSIDCV